MKTLRIALAAAAAAAFAVLGLSAPAQAYPVQGLFIGSNFSCCGDFDISVQVTSSPSGVTCSKLTVSATNGARIVKGSSRAASQTFTNVTTPFTVRIGVNPNDDDDWNATTHAVCTYDDTTVPKTLSGTGDTGSQSLFAGGIGRFSTSLTSAIQTISASGTLSTANCAVNGNSDDSDSDNSDSDNSDSDDSDSDDGGLPNTGGERLLWLLIGLLLVAGGTTVIVSSRREDGAES